MRKHFGIVTMALIAVMTFFTSCEKNIDVQSSNQPSFLQSKADASTPLDFIGITHNNILDQVGDMLKDDFESYATLQNPTEEDRSKLLDKIKYSLSKVVVPDSISKHFDKDIAKAYKLLESERFDEFFTSMDCGRVEQYCKDAFNNGCDENLLALANFGITSAWSNKDTMSTIFFTVMKYSANYWTNASKDTTNSWYVIAKEFSSFDTVNITSKGISIKEKFNKVKKWLAEKIFKKHEPSKAEVVILCDATGALIGGLGLGGWGGAIVLGAICSASAAGY